MTDKKSNEYDKMLHEEIHQRSLRCFFLLSRLERPCHMQEILFLMQYTLGIETEYKTKKQTMR